MTREPRNPAVDIMASQRNGTLYTGVTADLITRVHDHRTGRSGGFAAEHACVLLVWFEQHDDMAPRDRARKADQGRSRAKKLALIETANGAWRDLYTDFVDVAGAVAVREPRACRSWP